MNEIQVGLLMIAIGILVIIGAALNWRIVSHSGKLLNRILGDTIARAVYAAMGLLLVIMGAVRFVG